MPAGLWEPAALVSGPQPGAKMTSRSEWHADEYKEEQLAQFRSLLVFPAKEAFKNSVIVVGPCGRGLALAPNEGFAQL